MQLAENNVDTLQLCDSIVAEIETTKLYKTFDKTFLGQLLKQDVVLYFEGVEYVPESVQACGK